MTESRDAKADFVSWVGGNTAATAEDNAVAEVIAQRKQPSKSSVPLLIDHGDR